MSHQYDLYMKTVVSLQNNHISLTDKRFPGVDELFSSPECADGHQKWVDFVMTFWYCNCICMPAKRHVPSIARSGVNLKATISAQRKHQTSTPAVVVISLHCRKTGTQS